jgi:hypothetical protein
MKTRLFIVILIFAFAPAVFAQAGKEPKISLKPAGLGRVTILKGKLRRVINLRKDIAGCAYVPAEFKKSLDKKGCSASPATLRLADTRTKNKNHYLLITSVAMGGCNVCGRCGAAESTTLIWLALDAALKETARQSLVIEDCSENIEILSGSESLIPTGYDTYDLKFTGDLFTITYEKTIFGDEADAGYEFTVAEYDGSRPELGFAVKSEKRKESSSK